jgi:hypothetical protein
MEEVAAEESGGSVCSERSMGSKGGTGGEMGAGWVGGVGTVRALLQLLRLVELAAPHMLRCPCTFVLRLGIDYGRILNDEEGALFAEFIGRFLFDAMRRGRVGPEGVEQEVLDGWRKEANAVASSQVESARRHVDGIKEDGKEYGSMYREGLREAKRAAVKDCNAALACAREAEAAARAVLESADDDDMDDDAVAEARSVLEGTVQATVAAEEALTEIESTGWDGTHYDKQYYKDHREDMNQYMKKYRTQNRKRDKEKRDKEKNGKVAAGGAGLGFWSDEEDEKLRAGVDALGRQWKQISADFFGGKRDRQQCLNRWATLEKRVCAVL